MSGKRRLSRRRVAATLPAHRLPPMPDAQRRLVLAELVRLCLGGRGPDRPELR